jgi:acyl-coenzyme A thioesterase PaaI-like protein
MTFADYSLFMIARDALADERGVTATLNGEFIGAVPPDALVECTGEVVKAGRSLIFLRGLITTGGEPVMTFSGVIKKLGPRR